MTIKNMWGSFAEVQDMDTPTVYLKEQAQALVKATGGILNGYIYKVARDFDIEILFNIKAPSLDYTYTLLSIKHGLLESYPLKLKDYANSQVYECKSKSEFLSQLEQVLQSEKVHKMITMLIAQSKD